MLGQNTIGGLLPEQYPFMQPFPHTWLVLLDGSDEARRAVQFVLPLVRNIDTLIFANAIGGWKQLRNAEMVEMNYPMTSANVSYSDENERLVHKNKLLLANSMSEMQAGYAAVRRRASSRKCSTARPSATQSSAPLPRHARILLCWARAALARSVASAR
jgi:hypothetical protein